MKNKYLVRYALYGALFGACFPVGATIFDILMRGINLNGENVFLVQSTNSLHLIIDTAPLFLGLFAALAGRKQDQVQALNANLELKIENRTKAIKEAQNKAEQAAETKSRFLSKMSHELRTPINAILGITDLIAEQGPEAEDWKQNINLIKNSGENLLLSISEILNFAQLESDDIDFKKSNFDLKKEMTSLSSQMAKKAGEKGLSISLEIEKGLNHILLGDIQHLKQVLVKLLDNAIKFSKKGEIRLIIKEGKPSQAGHHQLEFYVQDEGIGIDLEKQKIVFDSFTQAHSADNRAYDGAGLGLSICQKMVKGMGGTAIELKSYPGAGSTFSFSLPFIDGDKAQIVSKRKDLNQARVLLAEDNPINQIMMKKILNNWNANVEIAQNGEEALKAMKEEDFQLILMDLHMPEVDGYEATAGIRKMKKGKAVPIIALSADVFPETKRRVLESGFNGFVAKPFNQDVLYKTLLKFI